MKFIGIDLHNPLILLRVWLAVIWILPVLYGVFIALRLPKESPERPVVWLSVIASFMGSVSYFVGASTTFTSPHHFVWVAALLTFTPLSLLTWFWLARARERKTRRRE